MGIDTQYVREYYRSMTDEEVIHVLSCQAKGLTPAALEIVKEEINRRKLDPGLLSVVEAQQEIEEESKMYDPNGCPIDDDEKAWLEDSFLYLLSLFGKTETQKRTVLLPDRKSFPIRYDGSERCAFETLAIVAQQMEVPAEQIKLDFYDEELRQITEGTPGGMYWGKEQSDIFEISMARYQLDEPEQMVATLAHEIAHVKLLGENRMEENDEKLTDLTTMFFGLGIFGANAAFQTFNFGWSQAGYLSQMEWGYAMALFAIIRKEKEPEWASHLCTNVRADFLQSQRFISGNGIDIFSEL